MTRFLLIRHGETDAVGRYLAGAGETPLNDRGRLQVAQSTKRLRPVPLDAVVSSPVARARATAAPIAESHGLTVQPSTELTEFPPATA
jgi:probable phosphoglycerate mutase